MPDFEKWPVSRICSKSERVSVCTVWPTRREVAEKRDGSRPTVGAKFVRSWLISVEERAPWVPEMAGPRGRGGKRRRWAKISVTRQNCATLGACAMMNGAL